MTAAVGLLAQKTAGAAASALAVQAAGLVLGGVFGGLVALSGWKPGPRTAMAVATVAVLALLTTFSDPGSGVAQRWTAIRPVTIQPSVIVLPFVVWGWSRVRAGWGLAGLVGALALLMAAQPDAATCGGLFLAVMGVAIARRSVSASEGATIVVALAGTIWAATRPDDLPVVAHVERVVVAAFAVNPLIGIAAGLAMVVVPGLIGWRARSAKGDATATVVGLTGLWLGLTIAALVANYPVPVVGFGASSAIGWLVSVGLCLRRDAVASHRPGWSTSPRRR